jgi:hypothetical protein
MRPMRVDNIVVLGEAGSTEVQSEGGSLMELIRDAWADCPRYD